MKKIFSILFFVCLVFTFLIACTDVQSYDPSFELLDVQVDVISDRRIDAKYITTGEKKGRKIVPTALYFEFTFINKEGKITDIGERLKIKIEPHDELIKVSKKTVGFDIFNLDEYYVSDLGHGKHFKSWDHFNQKGTYILYYELGVDEEYSETYFLKPSPESLEILKDRAFDATLVFYLDNKEISRIDLNSNEKSLYQGELE
ncbi:hypothetical protein [Chengkuizengella axinellae]|uniref:DUF4352 domain-containing protein n=1 Tax=Chengkuizengella axinellae TaxID=3064388 RepID=A0ABT9J3H0_9BACL|nr:hypothetical protein [Chengkuizengella sp. 2205SS18-9]MDP5276159.1 hypothetical protein [Chengkuizengella sp. 2205SS18-9]